MPLNHKSQATIARGPRAFVTGLRGTALLTTISVFIVCNGALAGEGLKDPSVSGATMHSADIGSMPMQGAGLLIIDGAARPGGAALQTMGSAGMTNVFWLEPASSPAAQVPDVPWRTLVLLAVCFLAWQGRSLSVELRKADGDKEIKKMQIEVEQIKVENKRIELVNQAAELDIKAIEVRARTPQECVKAFAEFLSSIKRESAVRVNEASPQPSGANPVQPTVGK